MNAYFSLGPVVIVTLPRNMETLYSTCVLVCTPVLIITWPGAWS